jgi:hypothetical protein
MRTLHTLFLSTLAAAALTACGGGSDSAAPLASGGSTAPVAGGPVTTANVNDTPSPKAAATATLTATQATADALKTEVAAAFTASQKTALTNKLSFLSASANQNGLERTQELVPDTCDSGGTLDSEQPIAKLDAPTVGTSYNLTFNKCKISTLAGVIETNGKWTINFSRYTSEDDLAFVALFNGLTVAIKTETVTVNGGMKCDFGAASKSCFLSDGARGWETGISYNNGVLNGTYATKYADGTVTVKFVNYSDTSGTATITGKSPTKTVITRTSVGGATSLKIEITGADGVTKTF